MDNDSFSARSLASLSGSALSLSRAHTLCANVHPLSRAGVFDCQGSEGYVETKNPKLLRNTRTYAHTLACISKTSGIQPPARLRHRIPVALGFVSTLGSARFLCPDGWLHRADIKSTYTMSEQLFALPTLKQALCFKIMAGSSKLITVCIPCKMCYFDDSLLCIIATHSTWHEPLGLMSWADCLHLTFTWTCQWVFCIFSENQCSW